jgi:hypothetical protein
MYIVSEDCTNQIYGIFLTKEECENWIKEEYTIGEGGGCYVTYYELIDGKFCKMDYVLALTFSSATISEDECKRMINHNSKLIN